MSAILLDSSIVHYEVLGRGRPVIFLHGWVGSWRYWISAMQITSTSYRAYALDLWGFGDTNHNTLNYSLEQQANLLNRFLNEMGIGKIALVGHGLGALVGMTFATRFPQSVDRMMAVSCPLDHQAVNARLKTATPAELLAAGYNSNAAKLPGYLKRGGDGWRTLIPRETQMYLQIYSSMESLVQFKNRGDDSAQPPAAGALQK